MITIVNNTRGNIASLANLILSFICTIFILIFGYGVGTPRMTWFVHLGFLASVIFVIHQSYLRINKCPYTRIPEYHKFITAAYIFMMLLCMIVPLCSNPSDTTAYPLMVVYVFNTICMLFMFISVLYRNNQIVQRYLHPINEIIDGFSKSRGSIQMKTISSMSNSSLKEVLVTGDEESARTASSPTSKEAETPLSPSNKADGSSPRPSKVLKTWPKAEPFPVRALYSFKTVSPNELPFKKGDTITVLDCRGRWWQAQKEDRIGFIPSNYVAVLLKAVVKTNFTAFEDDQVSVKKDQIIEVMEMYAERCLVRNVEEKIGAVPTSKLEFIEE